MCSNIVNLLFLGFFFGTTKGSRIIGGSAGNIKQYPYQASIRVNGENHCGGAIISQFHILTAAHCIEDVLIPPFENVTVHTGTSSTKFNGCVHEIAKIIGHPAYGDSPTHQHDIAVITLAKPIIFDKYQKKIDLPNRDTEGGELAVITGWGFTSYETFDNPTQLQVAEMYLMKSSECQQYLSPREIHEEHICAYHKEGVGSCMGDSGGPLVADGKVVGITSWGVPCAKGYPDVYTKVYAYKGFIRSIIGEI